LLSWLYFDYWPSKALEKLNTIFIISHQNHVLRLVMITTCPVAQLVIELSYAFRSIFSFRLCKDQVDWTLRLPHHKGLQSCQENISKSREKFHLEHKDYRLDSHLNTQTIVNLMNDVFMQVCEILPKFEGKTNKLDRWSRDRRSW